MSENKIQARARILKELADLKAKAPIAEKDVLKTIKSLATVEDLNLLCSILLKEITGTLEYFDGVLSVIAINLTRPVLEKNIYSVIEKPDIDEEKKMFLINLLTQAGFSVNQGVVDSYVKNPEKTADKHTERFLKMAEVNPDAQVDFLDFFFGIDPSDRKLLLKSIVNDYSGDTLANILAPIIYSVNDPGTLELCIKGLLNSRSYLAYQPLDWLEKTAFFPKIVSLARKTKKELKIAGLRKEIDLFEYYKELFKDSKPHSAFVSSVDGLSNFSFIFAREHNSGAISTFFVVFNIDFGPVSCFGLSNIAPQEYQTVLKRFFTDTEGIPISFEFAKGLIEQLCDLTVKNNGKVPYELLCWRQLTNDIKGVKENLEKYMSSQIQLKRAKESDLKRAINSDFCERWFFSYSLRYLQFVNFIDEICALQEDEFEKVDEMVEDFINDFKKSAVLLFSIRNRFLYQAYFFKCYGYVNLAELFYAIRSDKKLLMQFFRFSIQKSVYEFFLNLQSVKDATDENNAFARQKKFKHFNFNSRRMLDVIEKLWTN